MSTEDNARRYLWLKKHMHVEGNMPDRFEGYRHWCGVYSKFRDLNKAIDMAMDFEVQGK